MRLLAIITFLAAMLAAERPAVAHISPISAIGTRAFLVSDPERQEAGQTREWMVQLFYPAKPAAVGAYASDPVLLQAMIDQHYYDIAEQDLRGWADRPAPAAEGAALAPDHPLPLILLSPGSGFARLNYAGLATALATRGYVVAIVDHPHLGISRLPDGRILRPEGDDETLPALVLGWSQDVSVVLDRLLMTDATALPLAGLHIDESRIAAVGHSTGGAVALDVCASDLRVDACANFEGALFGSRAEIQGVNKPALVVLSRAAGRPGPPPGAPDIPGVILDTLDRNGSRTVWHVRITGGSHTSFSDAPEVMPATLSRFGGELMPTQRSVAVYTGLLDSFLRAYWPRGEGETVLSAFLASTPEATARRKGDPA